MNLFSSDVCVLQQEVDEKMRSDSDLEKETMKIKAKVGVNSK